MNYCDYPCRYWPGVGCDLPEGHDGYHLIYTPVHFRPFYYGHYENDEPVGNEDYSEWNHKYFESGRVMVLDMEKSTSSVEHSSHYNQIDGIECLDVVRHFNFNLGNAIKYIWRCGKKGDPIEDLEKAIFYIKDEIKRIKNDNN